MMKELPLAHRALALKYDVDAATGTVSARLLPAAILELIRRQAGIIAELSRDLAIESERGKLEDAARMGLALRLLRVENLLDMESDVGDGGLHGE